MQVSKRQIVDFMRLRGDGDRAAQAEAELPDTVDLPEDDGLVTRFGVDPQDLAGDVPDHGGASPGAESGEAARADG